MSALLVLYCVLPFVFLFLVYELERYVACSRQGGNRRWLLLEGTEKLLLVLLVTASVLVQMPRCQEVWCIMFMGVGLNAVYTLLCSLVSRKYQPGTICSVALFAAALVFLIQHFSHELLLCAIVGAYAIAVNRKTLTHLRKKKGVRP